MAGKPRRIRDAKPDAIAKPDALPLDPAAEAIAPDALAGHSDLFAQHAQGIERTILELIQGIKVLLPYKKRKLIRGEGEWEVETEEGMVAYVYSQPPNITLLKFAAEQNRGKAAAKEAKAQASTLVLKLAVPGHDPEIDQYLAGLPEEILARYQFDPATLARVAALRPPAE